MQIIPYSSNFTIVDRMPVNSTEKYYYMNYTNNTALVLAISTNARANPIVGFKLKQQKPCLNIK